MKNPMVSIVIPTKNNEKTIELCLKSVKKQTYPFIEMIVVDGGSDDQTLDIVKKHTENLYFCQGGRSAQRNFGFKKAKGEIFLYLDSDMVLSQGVVREAVNIFNKRKVAGLYIPEIVEGNTFLSKILNFERSFYDGSVIDAVRFIRADIFKQIAGFDENLIAGEDWDLDRRVQKLEKVSSVSSPLYHLQYGLTLKKYIDKKIYYSKFIDKYTKKFGKNDEIIQKQFGFKYRYFQVFIENGKWEKIIKNPIYFIILMLVKAIVGFVYIFNNFVIARIRQLPETKQSF